MSTSTIDRILGTIDRGLASIEAATPRTIERAIEEWSDHGDDLALEATIARCFTAGGAYTILEGLGLVSEDMGTALLTKAVTIIARATSGVLTSCYGLGHNEFCEGLASPDSLSGVCFQCGGY